MFKSVLSSLFFLAATTFVSAEVALPKQFTVKERMFSALATFDVETSRNRLGYAQRTFLSLVPEYVLYDYKHEMQAKARMQWALFGATFDIRDNQNRFVGTVEERILSLFPTFDIYSSTGEWAATAHMNFLGTEYTVRDPRTKQVMATISRSFFKLFRDVWTVTIVDHDVILRNGIDPSEFVLIAVFQTNREYWEKVRRDLENQPNKPHYKMASIAIAVQEQMEVLQKDLNDVEPTDADYKAIDELVGSIYNEEDGLTPSEGVDGMLSDINQLSQLLLDDNLTDGEKSALRNILEEKRELLLPNPAS